MNVDRNRGDIDDRLMFYLLPTSYLRPTYLIERLMVRGHTPLV